MNGQQECQQLSKSRSEGVSEELANLYMTA